MAHPPAVRVQARARIHCAEASNMNLLKALAVMGAIVVALGLSMKAKQKQEPASIEFGGAQVSLGMTVGQVEKNLAEGGRHIELLTDKHTALVRINNAAGYSGHE